MAGECSHHCAITASHGSYKVNDIAVSIDSRKSVVLALLDLSAAFDTVDHFFLLSRLSVRFCICDYALNCFVHIYPTIHSLSESKVFPLM